MAVGGADRIVRAQLTIGKNGYNLLRKGYREQRRIKKKHEEISTRQKPRKERRERRHEETEAKEKPEENMYGILLNILVLVMGSSSWNLGQLVSFNFLIVSHSESIQFQNLQNQAL